MAELFDAKIALFQQSAATKEEALKLLADKFIESGCAKETFLQGLLTREANFPTGLNTNVMGVAIPHTDIEHVNRMQLGFMSLKEPVKFVNMENMDDTVDVKMMVMMALKEPHQQLDMLMKLMDVFQNDELLEKLYAVNNYDEFYKLIEEAGLNATE